MSETDWKPWSEETCHLDQKIGPEMNGREITSVHSGDAEFQAYKRADMIRQAMGQMAAAGTKMCLILEEAHEARDWIFLGYRGFQSYAEKELGLHHSHAYRLLEYARCIKALAEAWGCHGLTDIHQKAHSVGKDVHYGKHATTKAQDPTVLHSGVQE
jgi:hypothetical protein